MMATLRFCSRCWKCETHCNCYNAIGRPVSHLFEPFDEVDYVCPDCWIGYDESAEVSEEMWKILEERSKK